MGAIAQGLSPSSSPTENAHLAGPVPVVSKMLVALAKLGGTKIYSADFMATAEMPSSAAAAKALKRLVADGLIYLFGDEYRFFNPFLRTWLLSKGY